jgi:hypothetical protein
MLCYGENEKCIYTAHVLLTIRVFIRMVDLENTRHLYDPIGNWYFLSASKLTGTYANIIMMINNFQLTAIRLLVLILIVFATIVTTLIGIYDLEYVLHMNVLGFVTKFLSIYMLGVFQMYVHKNITIEIIESVIGRIEEQSKFQKIVQNLKESLLILH